MGLFRVLSNSLFFIEESLENKKFCSDKFRALFVGKLIFELGIVPGIERCLYTEEILGDEKVYFNFSEGGFSKINDANALSEEGREALHFFRAIGHTKFSDYEKLLSPSAKLGGQLFNYLCSQFNLEPKNVKSAQAYH